MRKANPAFCDRSKSHKKLDPFDDRKMVHWLAENPFLVRSSAMSVSLPDVVAVMHMRAGGHAYVCECGVYECALSLRNCNPGTRGYRCSIMRLGSVGKKVAIFRISRLDSAVGKEERLRYHVMITHGDQRRCVVPISARQVTNDNVRWR